MIGGVAAPFNTLAHLKGYSERILPGAFRDCLRMATRGKMDPACLFNHDPNMILGRFSNRMLSAEEISSGLSFTCQLPNTSVARDLHALIKNRSVTGCSFGFACNPNVDDVWDEGMADGLGLDSEDEEDEDGRSRRSKSGRVSFVRRTIKNFSLLSDLGPVTFPAYSSGTSVNSMEGRSMPVIPESCPMEFRSRILEVRGHLDDVQTRRKNLLGTVLG
jgi:HK97 family phage prohead protease